MFKSDLRSKSILISGASGFIGQYLSKRLIELGANVIAIIHNNKLEIEGVDSIIYDGNYKSLFNQLENKRIDVVVNLATVFVSNHKPDQIGELIDSNIKFGAILLEITKQIKIPFFINTTTYAQSFNHDGYNPQNLYAATKQSFEAIIKYYEETTDIRFVTLELTDTYGPNDTRPKFVNLLLNSINQNTQFNMSLGEQEINYLYIDDAVNAFIKTIQLLIAEKIVLNSKFSICSDETLKLKELVDNVCHKLNSEIEINRGYYPYREREIMTFEPSYRRLPTWEPKTLITDGILKMI